MRTAWIAVLAACALPLVVGCGGGTTDESAPTMTGFQVSPTSLTLEGGDVTIQVTVTDATGIGSVQFRIVAPSGTTTPNAVSQGSGLYSLTYAAAPNTGFTDQVYTVTALASDTLGHSGTSSPQTFTVEAATAPPPPPPMS
jgi:large repetitive protein